MFSAGVWPCLDFPTAISLTQNRNFSAILGGSSNLNSPCLMLHILGFLPAPFPCPIDPLVQHIPYGPQLFFFCSEAFVGQGGGTPTDSVMGVSGGIQGSKTLKRPHFC